MYEVSRPESRVTVRIFTLVPPVSSFQLMIIVEDSIWSALLSSLHPSSSPLAHKLKTIAPCLEPDRTAKRAEREQLANSISEVIEQIENVLPSLTKALENLVKMRKNVLSSFATIDALPPELIQHIVLCTVESPSDHAQILRLSQVSCHWRAVVHQMPSLFVSANWLKWPDELLDEWCSRAQSRPRTITLSGDWEEDKHGRLEAACLRLKPHVAQLHTLKINALGPWKEGTLACWVSNLLEGSTLNLRHLCILSYDERCGDVEGSEDDEDGEDDEDSEDDNDEMILVQTENFPLLKTLYIAGISPRLEGMHSFQLTNLGCTIRSEVEWRALANILRQQPTITHLSIDGHHLIWLYRLKTSQPPSLLLPSLTYLRLKYLESDDEEGLEVLARAFVAPNVHSLELHSSNISLSGFLSAMVRELLL